MTQKKPTTNEQLAEMRDLLTKSLDNRGQVISVDRQLQERNATLTTLLYGAVAKHGIGHPNLLDGVLVSSQVPAIQIPAEQQLDWEVSEDGRSVMLYIIQTAPVEGGDDKPETSPAEVETGGGETAAAAAIVTTPEPSADVEAFGPLENIGIGDEFEDEMEVGLGD